MTRVYITHGEFKKLFSWSKEEDRYSLVLRSPVKDWVDEYLPGDRFRFDVRLAVADDEPDPSWDMAMIYWSKFSFRTGASVPTPPRRLCHLVFHNDADAVLFRLRWSSGEEVS